jgi:mannonate dehydratase
MNSDMNRKGQATGATSRRDFIKAPLVAGAAGALLAADFSSQEQAGEKTTTQSTSGKREKVIGEYDPENLKIARRVSADISDSDLLLLKQIGLRWAGVVFGENGDLDYMRRAQNRFARFGIKIFAGRHYAYRNLKIQLGQPGRDQYIEQYQSYLRNLGKLGIPVSSYDFHPANTYTTGQVKRRGYVAREFKLKDFREKIEKQRFDREYSAEEIWENYEYFMKAVLPVAEEADVWLSLHPDDPPISKMNGVAKVFTHYNGYKRAEKIAAGSKHWGLELCVGTWLEGGDEMGKNVIEMIRDFGSRGKLLVIHFRNVSSPLPHFVETFHDDGYQDMYLVMKALREVRFNGLVIPDHIPQLAGDKGIRPIGTSYCISYMRSLLRRANQEVG